MEVRSVQQGPTSIMQKKQRENEIQREELWKFVKVESESSDLVTNRIQVNLHLISSKILICIYHLYYFYVVTYEWKK